MNLFEFHTSPAALSVSQERAKLCVPELFWDGLHCGLCGRFECRSRMRARLQQREPAIALSADISVEYARHVLRRRFIAGEAAIARSPAAARRYANEVMRCRWAEAEPVIFGDPQEWELYSLVQSWIAEGDRMSSLKRSKSTFDTQQR